MATKNKQHEKVKPTPVAKPRKAVPPAKGKGKQQAAPVKVKAPVKRKRHPKRDLAKTMFLAVDLSVTEIARQLVLELKTVSSWRKDDNWDDEKLLGSVTPMAIRKQILEMIAAKMQQAKDEKRLLTDGEADAIGKLSKAAEGFLREIGPQVIMEVLYGFMGYADERDHEFALRFGPMSLDYVKFKLNEAKGM